MKIVYIHEAIAKVGGIERIYADKMNYLSQKGYDIYLLTTIQAQHPYAFPLSPAIKHIDLDTRHHLQYQYHYPKRLWIRFKINYLFKKRLKEQIKKIDPDIICCTTSYGAETVCKLNCRAKIIIESHSAKSFSGINDGAQRGYISKKYNAFIVAKKMHIVEKECDALVTLTQGDANEWKCKNKTRVIPNIFNEIPEVKSNQTLRRVIGVGRLEYQKRFDNLISVWKIVNKKHPDWILDIFGEGS
ncbi:MAG: glycosyltransferase, partial [Bacteroides sp.]